MSQISVEQTGGKGCRSMVSVTAHTQAQQSRSHERDRAERRERQLTQ